MSNRNKNRDRVLQTLFDVLIILLIMIILVIVHRIVEPKQIGFYCNDSSIFYPKKASLLTKPLLIVLTILIPIIVVLFVEMINIVCFYKEDQCYDTTRMTQYLISTLHPIVLFLLGSFITLFTGEIFKRFLGKLRPHFINVCLPDLSSANCTSIFGGDYIDIDVCTGDRKCVNEARQSFPSMHAGFSFYTMFFIIIYLQARLVLLRLRALRPFLQTIAFSIASILSITRITEFQNHVCDVLAGAALGIMVAIYITIINGRVIWLYAPRTDYHDLDLKENYAIETS